MAPALAIGMYGTSPSYRYICMAPAVSVTLDSDSISLTILTISHPRTADVLAALTCCLTIPAHPHSTALASHIQWSHLGGGHTAEHSGGLTGGLPCLNPNPNPNFNPTLSELKP